MNNEPVAWKYKVNKNNTKTEGICTDKHYLQKDGIYNIEPLYTHPAKTLTDKQIEDALYVADITLDNLSDGDISMERIKAFVRTVLRKAQEK